MVLVWALALGLACHEEPPPAPISVEVGKHRLEFRVPADWLHADHGREQRFEHEMAQISLGDLGPATPEGFANTIRDARDLFAANQWEDARALLDAAKPRRFFSSETRWKAVQEDWKTITRIRRRPEEAMNNSISAEVQWEVEASYHDLLVQISSLSRPDLESLAKSTLDDLGHDSQRGIALEEALAISGRPALRIDTWDRLSHRWRMSHANTSASHRGLSAIDDRCRRCGRSEYWSKP